MRGERTTRWKGLTAMVVLLCVVGLSLIVPVAPAVAESGDSAPLRPLSEGGNSFPDITGPEAPEEYPFELAPISPEITVRQIGEQKVIGEYIEGGYEAWAIEAGPAHDADGATVPTTIKLTEGDIVTLTVHYRAGNPAADWAPFVFPITGGKGWEGGYRTSTVSLSEPAQPTVPPTGTTSTPCSVPSLHGLSLKVARARLRRAHCSIGQVRLAPHATKSKGKVVKQSTPAGTQMVAGAFVAVRLGLG